MRPISGVACLRAKAVLGLTPMSSIARPRFKYFSWHTALLGGVLNLVVMFFLNWTSALIAGVWAEIPSPLPPILLSPPLPP